MARRIVIENYVLVVGKGWNYLTPPITISTRYNLSSDDLDEIGEFTRPNVERWLRSNSGDFSEVFDFYATKDAIEIPWETGEGEEAFYDTVYER